MERPPAYLEVRAAHRNRCTSRGFRRVAEGAQIRLGEERGHSGGGTVLRLMGRASPLGEQRSASSCPALWRELQVALPWPIGHNAHQLVEVLARLDVM